MMKTRTCYQFSKVIIFVILFILNSAIASDPNDVYWDDRFNSLGVNGTVLAMAVNGTDLYIGGSFTMVGSVAANNIAKWDGTNWTSIGSGVNNGTNGNVNAIAANGSNIYVGGSFSTAGGVSVNNVALWNGSNWSGLSSGISNGDIRAIVIHNNDVYVGGIFSSIDGVATNNIAKWNGSAWSPLDDGQGNGVNGPVYAIAVKDNIIYTGGSFTTAGGNSTDNIASWNIATSTWSALGSGTNLDVNAIVSLGSDLFAGGTFTTVGGVSAKKIARWDGSNWNALANEISGGDVNAMTVVGSELFIAGSFAAVGNLSANKIARWNGSNWSALGSGIDGGLVFATANIVNDIFVGGSFTTAGGKPSNKFARWNDENGPVPIELLSFSGELTQGNRIELKWATATEQNNYGFDIERKVCESVAFLADGANKPHPCTDHWAKIGFIPGNGTTVETHHYQYVDNLSSLNLGIPTTVKYRLKQIDLDGKIEYHGAIEVKIAELPDKIFLLQNYPNPFNPQTTIEFALPKDGFTSLKIYNISGQEVQTLVDKFLNAGVVYKTNFQGSNLPSGFYFYILTTSNPPWTIKKRMLLIK
ncbi:MAG: T9SS type A sorting domain-containing protein [bacterium]